MQVLNLEHIKDSNAENEENTEHQQNSSQFSMTNVLCDNLCILVFILKTTKLILHDLTFQTNTFCQYKIHSGSKIMNRSIKVRHAHRQ